MVNFTASMNTVRAGFSLGEGRKSAKKPREFAVSDQYPDLRRRIAARPPRSFTEIVFTFLIAPAWFSFGVPASGTTQTDRLSRSRARLEPVCAQDGGFNENRPVDASGKPRHRRGGTSRALQPEELVEKPPRGDKPEPPIGHPPRTHLSVPSSSTGRLRAAVD